MLLGFIAAFVLVAIVLPGEQSQISQATYVALAVSVAVAYMALTVALNLRFRRLLQECSLADALEQSRKGLARVQREDFLRPERWRGELRRLNADDLKQALSILEVRMLPWTNALPRNAKYRIPQVLAFLSTVEDELLTLPDSSPEVAQARVLREKISEALPTWKRPIAP